jgi:hypothetical protein
MSCSDLFEAVAEHHGHDIDFKSKPIKHIIEYENKLSLKGLGFDLHGKTVGS